MIVIWTANGIMKMNSNNSTDREHLLSHMIIDLMHTVEFLEGCLYNPDKYSDLYPEMRERDKDFYVSIVGEEPFCHHMFRSDMFWVENPDCPGCQFTASWDKYVRPVWAEWCENNGVKD